MLERKKGYSGLQISLHWLIALLVLFQLVFGESMTAVMDAAEEGATVSPSEQSLGAAHYWIGIAILALVLVRLIIRLTSGAPEPAAGGPGWMLLAAKASHTLFYVLLIAAPVLGLMAFYIGGPWGDIHSLNKPLFIILIAIHALAALYHQFGLRDGTLRRMLVPAGRD